jgi:exodeoxyribonuclease VII small subunit
MTKKSFSLEKSLKRLEEILQILESGDHDIEDSISLFEEGLRISNECQKHLADLEKRVKILMEKEDGTVQEYDFNEPKSADAPSSLLDRE